MIYNDELKCIHKNLLSWYGLSGECFYVSGNSGRNGAADSVTVFPDKKYDNIIIVPDESMDIISMVSGAVSHLKEDGRLIVAADNKFALKYFSGVANESSGRYFGSITSKDSSTVSLKDISDLEALGLYVEEKYYPYPDFRLPRSIYRSDFVNEMKINPAVFTPAYDKDRYVLFDEEAAMRELIKEGIWENFVNSYLLVLKKYSASIPDKKAEPDGMLYARFNTERAPQYRVDTFIKRKDGKLFVEKKADSEEAVAHLEKINENYKLLSGLYRFIKPVPCDVAENGVLNFEYVEGKTLDRKLYESIIYIQTHGDSINDRPEADDQTGRRDQTARILAEFEKTLNIVFDYNPEALTPDGIPGLANVDCILSNFIEDNEGTVWLIDYEWIYEKNVNPEYLKYRTCFYFYQDHPDIEAELPFKVLMEHFGIDEKKCGKFAEMEDKFQQKVYGENWKYQITRNYAKKNISFEGLEEDFRLKENHIKNLEESNARLRRALKNPVAGVSEFLHKKFST